MKSQRGAVALTIFITMLIFSLYGIIYYANSSTAFIRQQKQIISIQNDYSKDISNISNIIEHLDE